MADTNNLKEFRDPLLAELNQVKSKRTRPRKEDTAQKDTPPGNGIFVLGILFVIGLSVLGYYLYQAQQEIRTLSTDLSVSQEQLGAVSADLEESRSQISVLDDGLDQSRKKIADQSSQLSRYKGLYQTLKEDQQQQTRELEALEVQKANLSAVNELKNETTQLRGQIEDTSGQIEAAQSSIATLDKRTLEQQEKIDRNQSEISSVRLVVDQNTSEIGGIKRSLEREYYNFELQEGGGYMKVLNVALSLKDTDTAKRQFDMYLLADGKVIRKKDHSVNEPILFYVEGVKKPYQVVVTRVDRKLAVGYLSVPKS